MSINIADLLAKADLVQLAEKAGAKLRKYGNGARGACPLHGGDNQTAFSIYTDHNQQKWHCHTDCNAGGDAVEFIQRWQHLPHDAQGFKDAVRMIATIMGYPAPEFRGEDLEKLQAEKAERRRRSDLMDVAAAYYTGKLPDSPGMAYALNRWNPETITDLKPGYSDGRLLAYLIQQKADLTLAQDLGLIYTTSDGAMRDAIPADYLVYIHRYYGAVTYMTGRATHTDDQSKKSRNLHAPKALYWALHRKQTPLLIVEGQACAMTAYEWHYNAVALCGCAISDHDAAAMQGFPGAYLILDNDVAYDKIKSAADKAGPLLMIVQNLPAHDLNAWRKSGGTADDLTALIALAKPWIELEIQRAAHVPAYELETAIDDLARLVAKLPMTMRGKYLGEICDKRRLTTRKEFRAALDVYTQDDASSGFEIQDGRLVAYGDPLMNGNIQITHELAQDDGINPPDVMYTVAGAIETGEPLEPITIPAEEFDGMKWIPKHWGARPILYTAPGKVYLIKRAIQETSRMELKRERVHTHTGWSKIDGQWRYLTTAGGIGAEDTLPDIRVDVGHSNLSRYALAAPPADLTAAITASLGFLTLAPLSITVPLLLAMYAAPLSPWATLDAVLWVYGTTQSGKSTISHLALSHYGPTFIEGRKYHSPRSFSAGTTITDIEYALFSIKDAPVIVDDYAPAHGGQAEARDLQKVANRMIRMIGDRAAKGRSTTGLKEQKQRPPRSLAIATAENPIIGQSTVGRTIYVPIDTGDIFRHNGSELSSLDIAQRQAQDGLYAQAMAGYVAWLSRQYDALTETLSERINARNRQGRETLITGQNRLGDYYGLLSITGDLLLDYAQAHGAITGARAAELSTDIERAIFDLLSEQAQRTAQESPVLKLIQAMTELSAQRRVYLAPAQGDDTPPAQNATLLGWYDATRVYLMTNVAMTAAKHYWNDLDDPFDIRADAMQRQLWQQNYVAERSPDNHIAKVTYINPKIGKLRVLNLDAQKLANAGFCVNGHQPIEEKKEEK